MKILPIEVVDGESVGFEVTNYHDAPDSNPDNLDRVMVLNVDRSTGNMFGGTVIVGELGSDKTSDLKVLLDSSSDETPVAINISRKGRQLFAERV